MTVMTRKSEELLAQLIAFAGDPRFVTQALIELNAGGEPPSLEQVARRIQELRNEDAHGRSSRSPHTPTAAPTPIAK